MSGMLRPSRRNSRPRNMRGQVRMVRPTPIAVVSVAEGTTDTLVFTFNQPVGLQRVVPKYLLNGTAAATAAVQTSPTSVTVTFAPPEGEPSSVTVPYEDPAVRNTSQGYVNAGIYTIGATAQAAGEDGQAAGFVGPGPQTEAA